LRKHNGTLDVSGLRPHRGEEIPLPRHHGKREETASIEEAGSNLGEVTARKDEKAVTAVEYNAGMVAKESEVVTRGTAGGDLLSYRHDGLLRELGEGEFSLMERRFSETGEFHFSGDSKIESADDVAYMMRNLEMKSVEHSFAVLTTHSPYVLNCLSILALASKAYGRNPEATAEIIDPALILPEGEINGWFINQGRMESIFDQELSMLLGDRLDGVSDISEDLISQLTDVIYG
ncbi:MAG: hypothetical protein K2L57_06655, partial [Muribaculaceae bacterium]|nr:hypothetical protein [Muribaculaceae bacterium]